MFTWLEIEKVQKGSQKCFTRTQFSSPEATNVISSMWACPIALGVYTRSFENSVLKVTQRIL